MLAWLSDETDFPPAESALRDPNGLLAAGGNLSVSMLITAYRRGVYPWYSQGQPILWWSPDPRMVLFTSEVRISRSLAKVIRKGTFEVRVDTAFPAVVHSCASIGRSGQAGTWITPAMEAAYGALHDAGFAHSIEAWLDGQLVGGLYGIGIDRMFFGESMFASVENASKVALNGLISLLRSLSVPLIDCQQETAHLASFGARPIPRAEFLGRLDGLIELPIPVRGWPVGPLTVLP